MVELEAAKDEWVDREQLERMLQQQTLGSHLGCTKQR